MHSVEQLIFHNQDRFPVLMGDDGMPHFWITLFMTVEVRNDGREQNTMNSYLYDLTHFLLWEKVKGRDVLSEFQNKRFLSKTDIVSIRDFCLLDTKAARQWHNSTKSRTISKLNHTYPSSPRTLVRISGSHAKTRFSRISSYLYFVATTMLRTRPDFVQILDEIDKMKEFFEKNKPSGKSKKRKSKFNPDADAPPPEVVDKFMELVKFDSPDNPYRNEFARRRNEALYNLMYDTGARGAELLTLTLESITWHAEQPVVKIEHLPSKYVDPRHKKPSLKTEEREIPLSGDTKDMLWDYAMNVRAKTKGVGRHGFLFVSHQGPTMGKPLTLDGFNDLVSTGVKRIAAMAGTYKEEDLLIRIKKHGFRHNFNFRISEMFDLANEASIAETGQPKYSDGKMDDIRMYLNGWVDPETARTYNKRKIKQEADRFIMADQEKLSAILRRAKK
jgi:integrase